MRLLLLNRKRRCHCVHWMQMLFLTVYGLLNIASPAATFSPILSRGDDNVGHRSSLWATTATATTALFASTTTCTSNEPLQGLEVCIVGAGPSGLLLAHRLAAAGASSVDVHEARRDPRSTSNLEGRAYALGLGIRGRTAIRSLDEQLWQSIRSRGFESERFNLYVAGLKINLRDADADANDVSRVEPSVLLYQTDLCAALLDQCDTRPWKDRLHVKFQQTITNCDFAKKTVSCKSTSGNTATTTTTTTTHKPFDLIVGCDGVNSVVRTAMDATFPDFQFEKKALPGNFKVCRLNAGPPKLDPTSVALLLPSKGTTTAFVEPTINGSSCILFAGRDKDPIMEPSSNRTETVQTIVQCFPLLEGCDLNELARQLETQSLSTASSIKSNIYHCGSIVALCGDAAHATGGVSGQGVNSALVDASILADCLESFYDPKDKETGLQNALLVYSQRQVPEGYALYDLSFGPSPKGIFKKVMYGLITARDTLFRGRFGIGEPPLQTLLTTSLKSFADIRRDRNAFYDEPFPYASSFNQTLAHVYSQKEMTVSL